MLHRQNFFAGTNAQLFEQSWHPDQTEMGEAKAALLIVHGLDEHSSRYARHAADLVQAGFEVYTYDQLGHGKSEGLRSYINQFSDLVEDLVVKIERVKQEIGPKPLFVMGHSMGGAVVTMYMLTEPTQDVQGFVLSSPAIKIPDSLSPILQFLAPVIGALFPKMNTEKLPADAISRDAKVVETYLTDPLVYRAGTRARMGAEILKACKYFATHFSQITVPFFVFHGTNDRLTDPKGSQMLYDHAASSDKTIELYEGLYHETLNEPERETVIQNLVAWLKARS